MNIVIIDDEPKIRNGLTKLLLTHYNLRHNIISYGDSGLALYYLEVNPVDLLFTDIRMPGINGLELIKKLRDTNKDVMIVIISGYSDFTYAQKAIELGVKRYLTKPTNPSDLFSVVDEVERILVDRRIKEDSVNIEVSNMIVKKAIECIARNFTKTISLKTISEELYISPNYLCRLFKNKMGTNLSDYIVDYRMKKAKKYLLDIKYKVSEVSEMVGYNDTKYFSSTFKKLYGISPIEFRNSNNKEYLDKIKY